MTDPAQSKYTGPTMAHSASSEPERPEERAKVYTLVKHLFDDLGLLLRKELALAASEVGKSVKDTKKGAAGLLSGAFVLNAGFLFLLAAATLGLAEVMDPWLAALIVGAVVTIIGMVLVQSGKKKFEAANFRPERTMDDLRKDRDTVRGVSS